MEVTLVLVECTTCRYWVFVVHLGAMVWDMEHRVALLLEILVMLLYHLSPVPGLGHIIAVLLVGVWVEGTTICQMLHDGSV